MKTIFLIGLIGCTNFLIANEACCIKKECHGTLLVKQGIFLPQDQALRNIFDCYGTQAGYFVEGAFRYNFYKGLNLEITGSYLSHGGRALVCQWPSSCTYNQCTSGTTCCGELVRFKMPTIGIGLKYFFEIHKRVEFSLGGAFKVLFVRVENKSPFVIRNDNKNKPGGVVNIGMLFNPYKQFIVELFADYLIGKVKSCPSTDCSMNCDLNISGFISGISLGCKF